MREEILSGSDHCEVWIFHKQQVYGLPMDYPLLFGLLFILIQSWQKKKDSTLLLSPFLIQFWSKIVLERAAFSRGKTGRSVLLAELSASDCEHKHTKIHMQTYRGFPVTEQVRLSESPSRKIPGGGTILTVGATVGRHKEREGVLGGSVREGGRTDERISRGGTEKRGEGK